MTRNHSVLGRCIAASTLFFLSAQVLAAERPRRPEADRMPHAVPNAPAPQQENWSASFDIKGAQHAAFDFAVGAPGKIAINIQFKGDAVAASLVKPGGEVVPFSSAAVFEYMASADDIKKGKQWKVDISLATPKPAHRNVVLDSGAHATGNINILRPAGGGTSPQASREIPKNANLAAARLPDQPIKQAPAALAQTVMDKRKGEAAADPAGTSSQQQYQPASQDANQQQYQQPYQPAPQDANQQQYQQPYQPTSQDASQQPYQPTSQDANQQPYQPAPQDPNQSQYQQQYQQPNAPAVQSSLQQQSPQYQQPNYQGQQYQGQQYQGQQYQGQQYQGQQYQGQQYQGQQNQGQQNQGQQYQGQQINQAQPANSPGMGSPGGYCTVKLSVDRSTINLVDANTGSERKHLSLGQDRVQKVFNSPDNAWSVAVYKIRGVQQYGFIALELAKCEDQLPVELSAVPTEARFDQAEVVLTMDNKEKRFQLRNSRVQ